MIKKQSRNLLNTIKNKIMKNSINYIVKNMIVKSHSNKQLFHVKKLFLSNYMNKCNSNNKKSKSLKNKKSYQSYQSSKNLKN